MEISSLNGLRNDERSSSADDRETGGHSSGVNKHQMIFTCLENPLLIPYFKYPEILNIVRKGNAETTVPNIEEVLEEEFHKQTELNINRLSHLNFNFSLCIFKFSMNNSDHLITMLISTYGLKSTPTFLLDCFKIKHNNTHVLCQKVCDKLETFKIMDRIFEIVTGNSELMPLRSALCDRLGINQERSEELERCHPKHIEALLVKLKSHIGKLRNIFTENSGEALKELAKSDRTIFNSVKNEMDHLEEKISVMNKKFLNLEKHKEDNLFYLKMIVRYPIIFFDGMNIIQFKEALEMTCSAVETLVELLNDVEDYNPPTKKRKMGPIECLSMYFVDSYLTKWTVVINSVQKLTENIVQRHCELNRNQPNQYEFDLLCPYIDYFVDTAENVSYSRQFIDEKHWMIVAFLKSWKASNSFLH